MPVFKTSVVQSIVVDFDAIGYYLEGTAGADTIYGSNGADTIDGKAGNDRLYGGGGNDQIFGGAGNDFMHGGTGADRFDGGSGKDTVSYSGATAGVVADLALGGTAGDAAGDTFVGVEKLIGSSHHDTLTGDAGSNTLDGGAGYDTLKGGAGVDFLFGGAGGDVLEGGAGIDFLYGGADGDTFKLNLPLDGSVDVIADFVSGVDKLSVADLGATYRTGGYYGAPRLSYSEGTDLPAEVQFNRNSSHYYAGPHVNHIFFDTDDNQLYVLKPIVQGYGRYETVIGFDTVRVAAIDGADHFTPVWGIGLI